MQNLNITFTDSYLDADRSVKDSGGNFIRKSIITNWKPIGQSTPDDFAASVYKYAKKHAVHNPPDSGNTEYYPVAAILTSTDIGGIRNYPVLFFDIDKKDNEEFIKKVKDENLKAAHIHNILHYIGYQSAYWTTRSGGCGIVIFMLNCSTYKQYQYYYHKIVKQIEAYGWKTDPKVLSERRNAIIPATAKNIKIEDGDYLDCLHEDSLPDDEFMAAVTASKTKKTTTHATATTKAAPTAIIGDNIKYSTPEKMVETLISLGAIDKAEMVTANGKEIIRIYMNGEDASTPLNWYMYSKGHYIYSYTDKEVKNNPANWFYKVIAKTDAVRRNLEWWDNWARRYFYFTRITATNKKGWEVVEKLFHEGVDFYEDKFEQRIYCKEADNPYSVIKNQKPQELSSVLLRRLETDYPDSFGEWEVTEEGGPRFIQTSKAAYLPNIELYANEHGKNRMIDELKANLERIKAECPDYLDKTPMEVSQELTDNVFEGKIKNEVTFISALHRLLFASVARAITDNADGYKFDNCIVLQGQQGIGKSLFSQELCGAQFHESMGADAINNSKDMVLSFDGKRIIELEECSKITRQRDANHIKAHLSAATDTIRKPYAAETYRHIRRYVHIATTNDSQFLKDTTGNRRFWCFELTHSRAKGERVNIAWLKDNRWKIWGYFYNMAKGIDESEWHHHTILPHDVEMKLEDIASTKVYEKDTKITIRMWFDKNQADPEWQVFTNRSAIDNIFGTVDNPVRPNDYNHYTDELKEVAAEYNYIYDRNRKKGKWKNLYVWAKNGIVPDEEKN